MRTDRLGTCSIRGSSAWCSSLSRCSCWSATDELARGGRFEALTGGSEIALKGSRICFRLYALECVEEEFSEARLQDRA